ncbi:MAG: nitroreductase family protein [Planctomycetes bacterium]|nr:nitroreductase family protein [Planctomycetota bacterium]
MEPMVSCCTIREFTEEQIPAETLLLLVAAAMAAPSAGDERPWHFVIIRSPAQRERILDVLPEAEMLARAPAAILSCGDLTLQKHVGFWEQACAAATENILIEAERLGLGAIWQGIHPLQGRVRRMRAMLHIPPHVVPFALVVLGRPAQARQPQNRFDPARVHYDAWQGRDAPDTEGRPQWTP